MTSDQDTQRHLLKAVDRFVREKLRPNEAQVAELDQVPAEIVQQMRDMGLLGLAIPEAYGGLELSLSEKIQISFLLSRTSPAFRSMIGTNNGIGSQGIIIDGSEEQKSRYLPRMASGKLVGSFCLTEPEARSDAGSLRTSARRDGDSFVLNGTKRFITNAPVAGLFTVFARPVPNSKAAFVISAFLVDADLSGIRLGKKGQENGPAGRSHLRRHLRQRSGARVSDPRWTSVRREGLLHGDESAHGGWLTIAGVCVCVAEGLIADSLDYAMQRRQFDKPIAEFQLVQAMLADMKAESFAARCMVEEIAGQRDAGNSIATEATCAKIFCSEMVGRVADKAVHSFGGAGYVADSGIERFHRDVCLFRIYEGTTEIQQLVIARNMIREARKASGQS